LENSQSIYIENELAFSMWSLELGLIAKYKVLLSHAQNSLEKWKYKAQNIWDSKSTKLGDSRLSQHPSYHNAFVRMLTLPYTITLKKVNLGQCNVNLGQSLGWVA
jgi:hypothetical protein